MHWIFRSKISKSCIMGCTICRVNLQGVLFNKFHVLKQSNLSHPQDVPSFHTVASLSTCLVHQLLKMIPTIQSALLVAAIHITSQRPSPSINRSQPASHGHRKLLLPFPKMKHQACPVSLLLPRVFRPGVPRRTSIDVVLSCEGMSKLWDVLDPGGGWYWPLFELGRP